MNTPAFVVVYEFDPMSGHLPAVFGPFPTLEKAQAWLAIDSMLRDPKTFKRATASAMVPPVVTLEHK